MGVHVLLEKRTKSLKVSNNKVSLTYCYLENWSTFKALICLTLYFVNTDI